MPLASSNRAQLRFIKESTFGTIPGAGNPNNLRMTGESLAFSISTQTSQELRSDRMTTDLIQVGASASGDINFELSYREYDPLFEAVMQNTWTVFGTNGVSAVVPTSATFAANTLTAGAATSGANAFTNLALGQWVKIAGSSISGQNKWAQVSKTVAPTTTVLTFEGTPFTDLTGNGGAAVTVSSSRLTNGVIQNSYTLERELADVAQFFAYRGMVANTLSLQFASGSVVGGSVGFMGKDAVRAASTQLPGSPVASKTHDVMNAVAGVGDILENGAALTGTFIKSVDLQISNNTRAQDAIGILGAAGVASGTLEVTGTMEVYLADGTMYDKFLNNTASSLSLRVNDGSLNGYVITLPKIKYGDARVAAGAKDQDVMLSMPFTALMDSVTGKMILIDRAGVAAA